MIQNEVAGAIKKVELCTYTQKKRQQQRYTDKIYILIEMRITIFGLTRTNQLHYQ